MPLQAGTRLGPYEVVSLVGAGGMGEVYRARDTRLGRSVALKILPPDVPAGLRARFEREAKAISALSHAHICALYDVGRERDVDYLVLELVEGETVASRLERGPLPLDQVLRLGIEIADALATAHRHGIVHRDLKPSNVMVTPSGAKLLDFGLARYVPGAETGPSSSVQTATWSGTALGAVIGTPQYMAPEQVHGLPADARTDIFALGMLLHEMATGRRAFEATTPASLVAKILTADVPSVSTVAPASPPAFDHLVERCLAKEPAQRWETAHDVKLQLEWLHARASRTDPAAASTRARGRLAWVPWVLVAACLAALLGMAWRSSSAPPSRAAVPAQFDVPLPPDVRMDVGYDRAEISPDGRRIVFSASQKLRPQLFVRDLASTRIYALDDTEGANFPFWSPDSQSVAFFANGKLKRVTVTGGPARDLADATGFNRSATGPGTWAHGTILFAVADGSIVRVPETGGTRSPLALAPGDEKGTTFAWPRFLPDGRRFLVSRVGDPGLFVASLDGRNPQRIAEDGSRGAYAAGRLVYRRGPALYARDFDPARLAFTGPERALTRQVAVFSLSDTGTLVYVAGRLALSRLTWFDRNGRRAGLLGDAGPYVQVALSPRGRRATVVRTGSRYDAYGLSQADLWDVDLASGVQSPLTREPGMDADPSWSPDAGRLAFSSSREGQSGVFLKDLVSGAEERLAGWKDRPLNVDQWTPDGRFVLARSGGRAVWAIPLAGDRRPRLLFETQHIVDEVHVSPGGRWVAYNANESGRWEVFIARFPEFTSKRQVSREGGVQPQWSGDGRELFYLSGDGSMTSVRVTPGAEIAISAPTPLFPAHVELTPHVPKYAVSADGQRFLALEEAEGEGPGLSVLVNWLDGADQESLPAERESPGEAP